MTQVLRNVRLYRMSMPEHECPWGLKAISLLQERGISFEDHRLSTQAEVESFKALHINASPMGQEPV